MTPAVVAALITGADDDAFVENFRRRVLQDALAEATSAYWLKRAEAFEMVGTPACDEIAVACRNKAEIALLDRAEVTT